MPSHFPIAFIQKIATLLSWLMLVVLVPLYAQISRAQISANGDTIVTSNGNQLDISSGTTIGPNQFFSFDRFNLSAEQIAVFRNRGNIDNVLAKVSGGLPSTISGQIQFLNGRPNFYFMNPAGIIFGPTAILKLPGSFTATTASGIRFGNVWWEVRSGFGQQEITTLAAPTALRFSPGTPGAIVNFGTVNMNDGTNLHLVGGTVINMGLLNVPGGSVNVATVAGNQVVQLQFPGSPLGIEVATPNLPPLGFTPATLPALITGAIAPDATTLKVNPDGSVSLLGANENGPLRNITVVPGDIYLDRLGNGAAAERLVVQSQGYLYGNDLGVVDVQKQAQINLIGDRGIDLGNITTQTQTGGYKDGLVNLQSRFGDIFVNTIDNQTGGINIAAKGLFQARGSFVGTAAGTPLRSLPTSLRALNNMTIRYNGATIPAGDPNNPQENQPPNPQPLDIAGSDAPFFVGPSLVDSVPQPIVLPSNSSGTVGAIEVLVRNPNIPPDQFNIDNSIPIIFQDRRFGTLPPAPAPPPPPVPAPPPPSSVPPSPLPPVPLPTPPNPPSLPENGTGNRNNAAAKAMNRRLDNLEPRSGNCDHSTGGTGNSSAALGEVCGGSKNNQDDDDDDDAAILKLLEPRSGQ